MGIEDKLSLLRDLKDKDEVTYKFLSTLALVTYDELKEVVDYLASKNVFITKARYLKVLGVPKNDIVRNFDILEESYSNYVKQMKNRRV